MDGLFSCGGRCTDRAGLPLSVDDAVVPGADAEKERAEELVEASKRTEDWLGRGRSAMSVIRRRSSSGPHHHHADVRNEPMTPFDGEGAEARKAVAYPAIA